MISGLITAIRTLSILPVPGKDAKNLASSLPWFPIVGFVLGSILYGIVYGLGLILDTPWPEGIAALVVLASILLTRALHLDGLADWADGFGGRGDRQKILAIMKDPQNGAFGVIALVMALLLQWVACVRIIENGRALAIVAAFVLSRTMQVELASSLPYARAQKGTASPFVNGARVWHRTIAHILGITMLCVMCGPIHGGAVFAGGFAVTKIYGQWCKARIGGVTGDMLGAGSVIVETTVLLAGAVAPALF